MEITAPSRWLPDVRTRSWGWTFAALVLVVCLALPMAVVVLGAFQPSAEEGVWSHIAATLLPEYLRHTLFLAVVSGGLALVFGGGTAWLVAMCDFPMRRFFRWALVLPLAVPAYMAAY